MFQIIDPPVILMLVAATVALWVALYLWKLRDTQGRRFFIVLMLAIAFWAFTSAGEFAAIDVRSKITMAKLSYIGIVCVSPLWFLFASRYSQHSAWFSPLRLAGIWLIPFIVLGLVLTNDWHGLIWETITPVSSAPGAWLIYVHGPGFWLHTGYAYLLMLIGTAWLLTFAFRTHRLYRQQVIIFIIAIFIPWSGNILYLLNLNPWPGLDLTPLAFALTGLVLSWGIFNTKIFDLAPVAREALIERMSDGVIVLGDDERLVDVNPAVCHLVDFASGDLIGHPVVELLPNWAEWKEKIELSPDSLVELAIKDHWVELRSSPLQSRSQNISGRLLVLRDITERKKWKQSWRIKANSS